MKKFPKTDTPKSNLFVGSSANLKLNSTKCKKDQTETLFFELFETQLHASRVQSRPKSAGCISLTNKKYKDISHKRPAHIHSSDSPLFIPSPSPGYEYCDEGPSQLTYDSTLAALHLGGSMMSHSAPTFGFDLIPPRSKPSVSSNYQSRSHAIQTKEPLHHVGSSLEEPSASFSSRQQSETTATTERARTISAADFSQPHRAAQLAVIKQSFSIQNTSTSKKSKKSPKQPSSLKVRCIRANDHECKHCGCVFNVPSIKTLPPGRAQICQICDSLYQALETSRNNSIVLESLIRLHRQPSNECDDTTRVADVQLWLRKLKAQVAQLQKTVADVESESFACYHTTSLSSTRP